MRSEEKTTGARASQGVPRRDVVFSLAVGAGAVGTTAMLARAAASPDATEQAAATQPPAAAEQPSPAAEQHDSIQKVVSYDRTARGAVFHCSTSAGKSVDVAVTVCTPQIIRIQMCPDERLKSVKSLLEIKEDWAASAFNISQTDQNIVIDTGAVQFRVQRDPWQYSLHDSRKEPVLRENVQDWDVIGDYRSLPIGFTTEDGQYRRSNETFYLAPGEHIYGFGESFARLDKTGETIDGWLIDAFGTGTGNVYKYISFLMSTRGYGVFLNTTSRVKNHVGSQSFMSYTLTQDDPRLDLFLIYGPDLKDVLSRYVEIAGKPAFPPKGSFGIWYSAGGLGVGGVAALEDLAKKSQAAEIPIDMLMLGNLFTTRNKMSDKEQIAYTRDVCKAMAKYGIKVGMYTAPMLGAGAQFEQEARAGNFAVKQKDGSPYSMLLELTRPEKFPGDDLKCTIEGVERSDAYHQKNLDATRGPCLIPDFTNPAAIKWWKGKIADRMKVGCYGITMSDFAEDIPTDAVYANGHPGTEMHNLYALLYRKFSYEAVEAAAKHRGLINARSGIAGMQRYPICWSGDPNCTWQDMANTMRAGLSIGLSGVPFWSFDSGGFNAQRGHLTPELWTRWGQMAMFTSHVRLNGGGGRAIWDMGDQALKIFSKYAKLRFRLLPYIYSHAYNASVTGLPLMRAMLLEFQGDPMTYGIEDQYMFGDAFLVAPVCNEENKRTVYLPKGTWYEYESGKQITGPATLHIEAPLDLLPLYVKDDTIIPMGPEMTSVDDKAFGAITLDIRVSSQAQFTLYDDDVDTRAKEIVACRAGKQAGQTVLELGASRKTYIAKFNASEAPVRVTLNGADLPRLDSLDALQAGTTGWYSDPSKIVYAKFDARGRKNQLVLMDS
jgi:alpha-D-xyloside xylohydrolase